jgi:site-specific recombinase XerD
MIGITTAVILDKRIKRVDDTYAVKLRVTRSREQKYFPLGKHLTIDQWKDLQAEKPKDKELKRLKLFFSDIEKRAIKMIDEMEVFSFQLFERKFNQKPKNHSDVLDDIQTKLDLLKSAGKLNSADSYKSTKRSLEEFIATQNRKKLRLSDITPEWLDQYETWAKEKGNSITTIGIYLRNLRTIINQAIEEGRFQREFYPFGKRKYQIPSGRNVKKALALEHIKQIVDYMPESEAEGKARDLWLFSYLCNGVNVKDIARLRYRNLSSKHISFVRAKTERSTKADQKEVTILRMPEIDTIIQKWSVEKIDWNTYVFGLLSEDDSPAEELAKIKQATKTINKYMRRIGEKLEIDMKLTTYTARHSFATILKRSGAPIEFISESLGHKDLKTTENYLDSFEDDAKESYQKQLLNFSKEKTEAKGS